MKKTISIFTFVLAFGAAAFAQDIHFSQFYLAPLNVNPGLTGAEHDLNVSLNYKSQWSSVAVPFKTMAFGFDMRLNRNKQSKGFFAAGINFYSDKAGDAKLTTSMGTLHLAYHVHLNSKNTLGAGVSAGMGQRSVDMGALKWGTQYDGTSYNASLLSGEPVTGTSSFNFIDFGGGIDWNYEDHAGAKSVAGNDDHKINIGVAVAHINQPKFSFDGTGEKLYMKYIVHGTATMSLASSNVAFCPMFLYTRQGPSQEIYAGGMFRFMLMQDSKYTGFKQGAAISFGAFVRTQDAIVPAVLLQYSNYSLGISYDVNTSGLKAASNARGGIEIGLRFMTPNPFQAGGSTGIFN